MSGARPEIPKTYDPDEVEPRLYRRSLELGVFHEEPDPARPPFIISMPPPNVTGRAHIGHGSTYTPMDALTRYHRMLGENADWIPGQDHAAIATETVLLRELAKEGETRESLGRERYLERAWEWRNLYGNVIDEQFQRLGFGPDWERERFTMDPGLSAAVVEVFVRLYEDGLIYRGTRLVNWDPQTRSTLSDAEVDDEERDTSLWHLRYRAEDGGEGVVVATTRPETYLGDVAVAVHPEDARYAHLIGKNVVLPIVERAIPVIADAAVERGFGTGAVKVTPAHDPTDYEIGRRHDLAMPTVIDFDGTLVRAGLALRRSRGEARADRRAGGADGAVRRARPLRCAPPARRRSARVRRARRGRAVSHDDSGQLALGRGDRAAALAAMVGAHRAARRAGARGVSRRAHPLRPGALRPHVRRDAGEHPRLEHLAASVVGASAPGVVHAGRRRRRRARRRRGAAHRARAVRYRPACGAIPIRSTRGSPRDCGRSRSWAGRSRRPSSRTGIRTR